MGFKKAGSKKKQKKAPGKKGRKDDWDFEGGQFTDEAKKTGDDSTVGPDGSILTKKRGPRKTQERDEYIRRGKAKIEDRKRKGQFEKKMSKKMRFGDSLRDELKQSTETEFVEPIEVVEKKKWLKSTKSVMERLQTFVKTDLARSSISKEKRKLTDSIENGGSDEGNGEADVDHEGEEEYEMDADEYEDLNAEDEDENEEVEEEDEEQDGEDESITNDADGEEQAGSDTDDDEKDLSNESIGQDDFDWIFNPKSQVTSLMVKDIVEEKPTDRNSLQKLATFDDFQLYGALHPKVAGHRRTPVKRYVIFLRALVVFTPQYIYHSKNIHRISTLQFMLDLSTTSLSVDKYSPHRFGNVTRIGEINGLHKMWRSRSQDEVTGRVANEILPFLGSYADILIEGAHID